MCKENKNYDFIPQFLLFCVRIRPVHNSTTAHACGAAGARREELLYKVFFLQFFAKKNCKLKNEFCRFIKLRLNHCYMDYFNDVLTTFLALELSAIAVYKASKVFIQKYLMLWRVRKLSDLIKNILICVLKMNEGLAGLERHEGE